MPNRRETLQSVSREDVVRNTLSTGLEGRIVSRTEINDDLGPANSINSDSIWFEGQTVTAVVVSSTTARNVNTLSGVFTEGLNISAKTSSSGAVMEDGAV